uniref:Uncharacterized protein n=1 Tax=Rhizophagus irregularis (strain DAOM 181602 / DAOM 197198 / MUCL 43194) TaxID=747089 RepID=U9T907_RHIID
MDFLLTTLLFFLKQKHLGRIQLFFYNNSSDTSETNTYDSTGIFIFEVCISITTNTSALGTFSANFNVDDLADAFVDSTSTDIFSSTATIATDDNAFNSALSLAIGNAYRREFNSAFLLATSSICESEFNLVLLLVIYGTCRGEFNSVLLWQFDSPIIEPEFAVSAV